jgi:phage virion morphogenesis protein
MDGASIRYQGEKKIFQLLDKLASPELRKQLLDAIGAYGVSSTQQRFLDQVSPEGKKWKKSRRAETAGGQTLRLSGRLGFLSMVHQASPKMAAWGTNLVYAGIHQFGGVIKAKPGGSLKFPGMNGQDIFVKQVTIPARPYLGISGLDRKRIEQIAGDWVQEMAL